MSLSESIQTKTGAGDAASWLRRGGVSVAVALGGVILAWLAVQGQGRLALAASVFFILFGLSLVRPQVGIAATLVMLTVLGDVRRMLIPLMGWSGQDPLLLVGPAVAVLLAIVAVVQRKTTLDTPLARWMVVLMGIMAVQVLNPGQGGLAVGLAGVLFYGIPILWFWIGRTYVTAEFIKNYFYSVIIPVALLAALMGLYQAFNGYLPYQMTWYNLTGYDSLSARGTLRPLSFFTSAGEYVKFVSIALVLVWAAALKGRWSYLIFAPIFVVAIFFGGSRGPIVLTTATAAVLWALMGRTRAAWLPRLALAVAIGGIGLYLGVNRLEGVQVGDGSSGAQNIANHVVGGLSNPLDRKESTAVTHAEMFVNGIRMGIKNPAGLGLGTTSLASRKFGGRRASSEKDISDMFISLGAVGGIVYTIVVVLVLLTAARYWLRTRTLLALSIVALLLVCFTQWLNGGYYAISALVWLCVGALDQFNRDAPETTEKGYEINRAYSVPR